MLAKFIDIKEVGDKWRLVIPKSIREDLKLKYKTPMIFFYNKETKQILIETQKVDKSPRDMPAKSAPQTKHNNPIPSKHTKGTGVVSS